MRRPRSRPAVVEQMPDFYGAIVTIVRCLGGRGVQTDHRGRSLDDAVNDLGPIDWACAGHPHHHAEPHELP